MNHEVQDWNHWDTLKTSDHRGYSIYITLNRNVAGIGTFRGVTPADLWRIAQKPVFQVADSVVQAPKRKKLTTAEKWAVVMELLDGRNGGVSGQRPEVSRRASRNTPKNNMKDLKAVQLWPGTIPESSISSLFVFRTPLWLSRSRGVAKSLCCCPWVMPRLLLVFTRSR